MFDRHKPLFWVGSSKKDFMGDTYRAVYTVKIAEAVYVLHCFQKKSKQGMETPKQEMDRVRDRLKAAQAHAKGV